MLIQIYNDSARALVPVILSWVSRLMKQPLSEVLLRIKAMEGYYANNCILGGKSQPARNTCPSVHISLHKAMKGKNIKLHLLGNAEVQHAKKQNWGYLWNRTNDYQTLSCKTFQSAVTLLHIAKAASRGGAS